MCTCTDETNWAALVGPYFKRFPRKTPTEDDLPIRRSPIYFHVPNGEDDLGFTIRSERVLDEKEKPNEKAIIAELITDAIRNREVTRVVFRYNVGQPDQRDYQALRFTRDGHVVTVVKARQPKRKHTKTQKK